MKYKIGYYILTDIQHIPPVIKIYEKLGGIIITKNNNIRDFILKNHTELNPKVILIKHTREAREISRKYDLKIIIYTGFQMINWGYSIQIFHGVSDKHYIEDKRILRYDLCLVPGQKHIDKFINAKLYNDPKTFKLVGYPKFDKIVNDSTKVNHVFDNGKPTILYAPTWISENSAAKVNFSEFGESSLPLWGKKIINAVASKNWNLIIKYHSRINKTATAIYDEIENYIETLGVENKVKVVWDADITPYMKQADILISDISAVCYEWFHLNRPIIFANPSPENYSPSDNVFSNTYAWNAGDVIYHEKEIIPLITENLVNDKYHNKRNELLNYAFYKPDGNALQRQIEEIRKYYNKVSNYSKLHIMMHNLKTFINLGK